MEHLSSEESTTTVSTECFVSTSQQLSFSRNDFVRLIVNSLEGLGLRESAERLQIESGLGLNLSQVDRFMEYLMNGNWTECLRLIPVIEFIDGKSSEVVTLIKEQEYIEYLMDGDILRGIEYLRDELSNISTSDRGSTLSNLLICPDKLALQHMICQIQRPRSRYELQNRIKAIISPNLIVTENRLENLIIQALAYQQSQCTYTMQRSDTPGIIHSSCCKSLMVDIKNNDLEDIIPCKVLYTLESHAEEVWVVAFSPNGRYLASASNDGQVKIWSMASRPSQVRYCLDGHSAQYPAHKLSWSADSRQLLSCGADPLAGVRRWDLSILLEHEQCTTDAANCSSTLKQFPMSVPCTQTYSGHAGEVASVAWVHMSKTLQYSSANSTYFVSGGTDRQLLLYEAATGRCLARKKGGRVGDIAVLPPVKTKHPPLSDSVSIREHGRWVRTYESSSTVEQDSASEMQTNGHHRNYCIGKLEGYRIVYVCAERWLRVASLRAKEVGGGASIALDEPITLQDSEFGCLALEKPVVSLAASEAGDELTVVVGLLGGEVHIVHIEGETLSLGTRLVGQVQTHFRLNLAVAGAAGLVAGGTEDSNSLLVWQTDGVLLGIQQGHSGIINSVSWSDVAARPAAGGGPSTDRILMLATGSDDGTVKLWVSRAALAIWESSAPTSCVTSEDCMG